VDVRFRTRKLQNHYERSGEAVKAYQRLIFTLEGDRLEIVMIEGVSKHYED